MTYQEMMENAKLSMGLYCKACPVCDGRACKNQIPGPGAKGVGDTAIRNYKKWQEIRVNIYLERNLRCRSLQDRLEP